MDLKVEGNIRSTVIIKGDVQIIHKVLEIVPENKEGNEESKWSILTTHLDNENKEVLDFYAYLSKEKIDCLIANFTQEAKDNGFEVITEEADSDVPTTKHYIFSDDSKAITYEDDYDSIEEAQKFCDLLIKQFGKNFTYHEVE